MRGEKQQERLQQMAQNKTAASVARTKRIAAARIIDDEGVIQFHIISTWWSKMVVAIVLLLLTAIAALTVLVIVNKTSIDKLEQKEEIREQQ